MTLNIDSCSIGFGQISLSEKKIEEESTNQVTPKKTPQKSGKSEKKANNNSTDSCTLAL